jgi:hypothetical protein
VEEALAGIWRELLNIEQVGRRDNFFELGGHSILATQMAMRAQSALSVDVPVTILFQFQTLNELAQRLVELLDQQVLADIMDQEDPQTLFRRVAAMPEIAAKALLARLSAHGMPPQCDGVRSQESS